MLHIHNDISEASRCKKGNCADPFTVAAAFVENERSTDLAFYLYFCLLHAV